MARAWSGYTVLLTQLARGALRLGGSNPSLGASSVVFMLSSI